MYDAGRALVKIFVKSMTVNYSFSLTYSSENNISNALLTIFASYSRPQIRIFCYQFFIVYLLFQFNFHKYPNLNLKFTRLNNSIAKFRF